MTELAREARWLQGEPRSMGRKRWETRIPALLPGVSLVLLALGLAAHDAVLRAFLGVFGAGGVILPLVWAQSLRVERRAYDHAAARTEFEGDYGRLVSLIVRQGDAPTGEDVGLLWFEEGRLYFSGQRTSFGLVPSQARSVSAIREGVPGVRNAVDLVLRRDTVAGAMALSFEPLLPPHESSYVHRTSLRTDLAEWTGVVASGVGQFPPTTIGPGVVGDRRLLLDALATTLPLSFLLSTIFHYAYPPLALPAFFLALTVTIGALPASNLRWRAWRDRRRLARTDRG